MSRVCCCFLFFFSLSVASGAEVAGVDPGGFRVVHERELDRPPTEVFDGLASVADWWDPAHTFSGDASALSLDPRARGCFCEAMEDGGAVHLLVVYAKAGEKLVLEGGLGPLQEEAVVGRMVWSLAEVDGGTRLTWAYTVSGRVDGGLETWAGPVDQVLGGQLDRFVRWTTGGSPEPEAAEGAGDP